MASAQVVVITGASAGIARATAREFGARGAQVGLLARGQAGLDGAVKDVENAGGKALAIPTDVADYDQVEAKIAPAMLDRYLARTGYSAQQTGHKVGPDRPHNLWEPVDGPDGHDHGAHGMFDERAHRHAPQLWLSHHARLVSTATAAAGVTGLAIAITRWLTGTGHSPR